MSDSGAAVRFAVTMAVADADAAAPLPVPPAFVRPPVAARLGVAGRLIALGVAAGCLAVLVIAASLPPSPDGLGTHTALGLSECGFLARFGVPCFSCGMTTSFAWFVRGNLLASLYVQPMGTVLAAVCGLAVWAGLYVAATGRPAHRLLRAPPVKAMMLPLFAFGLLAWGWKIFIHLRGIDGWR